MKSKKTIIPILLVLTILTASTFVSAYGMMFHNRGYNRFSGNMMYGGSSRYNGMHGMMNYANYNMDYSYMNNMHNSIYNSRDMYPRTKLRSYSNYRMNRPFRMYGHMGYM